MPPNQVKSVTTLDSLSELKNVSGLLKRASKGFGSSPNLRYRNPMHHSGTLGGLVRVDSSYWNEGTPAQANYWDWSPEEKEEVIFHICKTEEVRDLFTASHFESNLRKDAERRENEQQAVARAPAQEVPEGYWDMTSAEEDVAEKQPQEAGAKESYWEWSHGEKHVDEKEALIEKILSEERIRQSMTIDHLEKNLVKESEKLREKEQASYWDEAAVVHGASEDDAYWQEASQ